MIVEKNGYNELLDLFLDFGQALMRAGAEINRVEDTIERIGKAYGAVKVNVLVIIPSILLTVTFPDGTVITQHRRVHTSVNTDFEKLNKLNALSRKCTESPLPLEELKTAINEIKNQKANNLKIYLGSIISAGGFTLFFGGNVLDALVSSVFAVLICFLQEHFSERCQTRAFYFFITSLVSGFGICFVSSLVPALNLDKIIIGDIMLTVPGVAVTNAMRDLMVGDNISGLVRVIESLVWTGALVGGFMIPMIVLGV